jgi:hypothetical protein
MRSEFAFRDDALARQEFLGMATWSRPGLVDAR